MYSVGFYADLSNPNLKVCSAGLRSAEIGAHVEQIPTSAPPEEKIEHIVRNTACVLRIGKPPRSVHGGHSENCKQFLQGLHHTHTFETGS